MALVDINIDSLDNIDDLLEAAQEGQKTFKKTEEAIVGFQNISDFPIFKAEFNKGDGLIYLTINSFPPITFSPKDWNEVVIHLRDVYFPEIRDAAKSIRNQAIDKAATLNQG